MNPNIPFSQSLKKFVYKSNPLQLQVDRYLQRSYSYIKNTSNHHFPSLQIRPYSKQTNKTNPGKTPAQSSKYNQCDEINQNKGELLRETNVTNASKTSYRQPRQKQAKEGRRSNMAEEVDKIMNVVIGTHYPHLQRNETIKRSISTKKFKNVRVITDINEVKAKPSKKKGLIKEILDFMIKNSKCNRKGKKKQEEEQEVEFQDLSHFSPYKLLKKSQEVLKMHPLHQFKREEDLFLNQPLNSQNYIRQLRTSKMFVKDVTLKKY